MADVLIGRGAAHRDHVLARRRTALGAEWSAIPWHAVLGAGATGAALGVLDLWVLPGGPGTGLGWVVAALLGGAVALGLDSPAHALVAPTPVSQRFRTAARLALVLPALGVWTAYGVLVTTLGGGGPTVSALALIGPCLVLATCAGAGVMQRGGVAEPGGLAASVVLLAVVGLLVLPLPGELRPFDVSGEWTAPATLWSGVAGVAVILLWWATADQWRRTPGRQAREESPAGWPGRHTPG